MPSLLERSFCGENCRELAMDDRRRRLLSARFVGGISSALENPAINPITGPGRSSADDVKRELRAHQARVRRNAELLCI
eukprot:2885180-Pleurochrysis_carterae.AAC.1